MYGSFSGCMAAVAALCFFQLCGICAASAIFQKESPGVQLLAGSVLGSVGLQWLPALMAFFFGFTVTAHFAGVILATVLAVGSIALAKRLNAPVQLGLGTLRSAIGSFGRNKSLFIVLGLWLFFCYLVLHSFRWEDGKIFSSQATYGDMSMHLSFITSLARQGTFPPNYSLLPGARLSYPFLSDSISASLYLFGASLRLSYCLPMFLAGAQVLLGGWLFLRTLCGERLAGAISWVLFFFNGGFGIFYFLGGEPGNFTRIFTEFYQTPTNHSAENICWVNVIVDMMLPQRATLFGWAVLFTTLYLLYRAVFDGYSAYFPVLGVLAGALPMIHTHSFLALALVCGAWLTVSLCREDKKLQRWLVRLGKLLIPIGLAAMAALQVILKLNQANDSPKLLLFACGAIGIWGLFMLWRVAVTAKAGKSRELLMSWGLLLGITCLLALPQLFTWTFQQVSGGSMLRGHFAWRVTSEGNDSYLWFYLKNIGLTALLAIFGLLSASRESFGKYCPALAIWFLAEFVEFQPNNYDNNKLLYVGFLFICCAAADGMLKLIGYIKGLKPRQAAAGAALAAALMSSSAVLTMGREAVASYELFGEGAMNLAAFIDEELPTDAIVLSSQRHNNEAAALAGRNLVCGSPIYLYYHGLNYSSSENACRQMYQAPEADRALFDEFNVDYVILSDYEINDFEADTAGLDRLFTRIYDDGNRILYQVRGE